MTAFWFGCCCALTVALIFGAPVWSTLIIAPVSAAFGVWVGTRKDL